jgi:hypothetical protein
MKVCSRYHNYLRSNHVSICFHWALTTTIIAFKHICSNQFTFKWISDRRRGGTPRHWWREIKGRWLRGVAGWGHWGHQRLPRSEGAERRGREPRMRRSNRGTEEPAGGNRVQRSQWESGSNGHGEPRPDCEATGKGGGLRVHRLKGCRVTGLQGRRVTSGRTAVAVNGVRSMHVAHAWKVLDVTRVGRGHGSTWIRSSLIYKGYNCTIIDKVRPGPGPPFTYDHLFVPL